MPRESKAGAVATTIDRRVWPMIMLIGLMSVLLVKEISLPSPVILLCALVGLLGLLMTGLQHPELPFYVLVAYLPFSRVFVGDFGTEAFALNLTNILTIWALGTYWLNRLSRGQPLGQGTPLNVAIGAFALFGGLSLVLAGMNYGSWYLWEFVTPLKRWFTPVFFYFLTLWIVRDRRTIKTVATLIMVAVVLVALMAIRDYMDVGDSSFDKSRVGGIAEHSNTLGAFFDYYMFLLLGFFLVYARKLKAWLLLIPFALCFRGIMVTFSRGAYLAFAAGSLAACWFRSKFLFMAAVGIGLLLLINPVLLPAGIRYRMGMTLVRDPAEFGYAEDIAENFETSSARRIEIWRGAIRMIKDYPWWGVGYGAFPRMIPNYTEVNLGFVDAHNSYLLIAAEMGIPTLVVFLFMLLMVWGYTYWLYRHTQDPSIKAIALGFLAGLIGLLVANMFGSRMDDQVVSSYFWILCGLIMRGVLIERQERLVRSAPHRPSARL